MLAQIGRKSTTYFEYGNKKCKFFYVFLTLFGETLVTIDY